MMVEISCVPNQELKVLLILELLLKLTEVQKDKIIAQIESLLQHE